MRALLLREYNRRKKELEKRFSEKIATAEKNKRLRRKTATELLVAFIKEHPDHKKFTPDAMFRLANIYLDEADDEAERDENALADYKKSLDLWQRIVDEFPNYRQMAGTLYLLGYYGRQSGNERKALLMYLSLACANKYKPNDPIPPAPTDDEARKRIDQFSTTPLNNEYENCTPIKGASKSLVDTTWVRGIGDIHFFTPGESDLAISSFLRVANKNRIKSPLYESALYMLAWSYFRRNMMPEAAKTFDTSVVRYDTLVAAGKKPKTNLRKEAIEYIAVTFTDPWDDEELADPKTRYPKNPQI